MPPRFFCRPDAVILQPSPGPKGAEARNRRRGKINPRISGAPPALEKPGLPLFKRGWRWWVLAALLQIFWILPALGETPPPQVVILNSYHQGYVWSDRELAGVLERLRQSYPGLDPVIEHLDAKRLPGPDQQERMRRYLADKYRGRKLDLVITLDNPALDLAQDYRQELFPGVPLVFAGVNNFTPAMLKGQKKVTGVAEINNLAGTLELALSLHPGTREVLMIHDYTTTGLALRREMEAFLPALAGRVQVSFTPLASFQEVLERVKSLPPRSLGLIMGFATDRQGVSLGLEESTRLFAPVAVPLYAMHETRLGHGIVGGILLEGREHGRQAGEIALRVLAGEDPSRIPVFTKSTAKPMFDYLQLQRFHIPVQDLPPGSLVINRPESFYEKNKTLVQAVAAVIIFLAVVVVILSSTIIRRRRAEERLRESEEKFRLLVENANEIILVAQGDRIRFANPMALENSGYSLEELTSRPFLEFVHPDDREMTRKIYTDSLQGREVPNVYYCRYLDKDGGLHWVEIKTSDITWEGEPATLNCLSDITERKEAEEALRRSEESYRTVADFTFDMEYWIAPDWKILYMSPSCERLTGYTREEFLQDPDLLEQIVHPEDRPLFAGHIEKARDCPHHLDLDFRLIRRDGGEIWISHACQPVFGLNGRHLGRRVSNRDITARKQAEEALRQTNEILRAMLDAAPVAIFDLDTAGRVKSLWNAAAEQMLGWRRDEVLGHFLPTVPEEGQEEFVSSLAWVLSGKPIMGKDVVRRRKDGSLIEYSIYAAPKYDDSGKVTGSIAVLADITERKRVEEQLLLLNFALDHIQEAVYLIDANARFLSVNDEVCRELGYSREELLGGMSVLDIGLGWTEESWSEHWLELKKQGSLSFEALNKTKDGRAFPVEITANIFPYKGTDYNVALARDITERKSAEEALRESEERFRLLVENAPDAIFIQTEKRFAYLNKEALRLFGATGEDQLLGRPVLERFHPDFHDIIQERMRLVNEERKAVPLMEQQYLKMDGIPINVEVSVVPFRYQGKNGGLVFFRDITERKQAEKERKILETQLFQAQKMEALGALAGGIAHDFNNILGAMLGFAEMAFLELPEASKGRPYLENLLKAGDRARNLVKQILSFSRREKVDRQPLALIPIVKETLKFLRASIPSTIEIRTHINAGQAMVVADPTQINQILLNLATNAVHAMEEKGGVLEVGLQPLKLSPEEISPYEGMDPGAYLELSVGDTGCGMDPAVLERIYEPFFTTKGPGKGTGMGLSVVYGLVKSLGGTIQATSQPGWGTTFQVLFPLAPDESAETEPEVRVSKPAIPGSACILFVDDDEDFFLAGRQMLTDLGYEVVALTNSFQALKEFRTQPQRFDLIISDQTMPGLTGLDLAAACQRLRPDVPIILCTGFSEMVTPEKIRSAGIREVVAKPFDLQQISRAIQKTLKKI